ncbi:MAG: SGNH/GDSL hydrolase family protein [Ruminococcus flavefaciens]|nr:SGNH/GDSL hydrolase family protein [Ruminococcus flavefaciens]
MKLYTLIAAILMSAASMWAGAGITWHASDSLPLLGKCVDNNSTSLRYQRLPDSLQNIVKRPALYALGRHSSGMAVRFASNAPDIHLKWKSVFQSGMEIMTPVAVRGLDLYMMMPDSTWTYAGTARPNLGGAVTETRVIGNMDPEMREYMVHLSLYDGVDSLYIGVDSNYVVTRPEIMLPEVNSPVVYYGTSLVHGGCVNRTGMSHTNQLRRRLNRDVVNLGFGGNGQLDLEIAHVIAATPHPSLVILDFVPNCSSGQIDTLMIPFVDIVRQAHPEVPILFIECLNHPRNNFDNVMRDATARHNAMMRRRYEDLLKKYDNLHYLPASSLQFGTEHTVDALHLTDYGALMFADALEPILRSLITDN